MVSIIMLEWHSWVLGFEVSSLCMHIFVHNYY